MVSFLDSPTAEEHSLFDDVQGLLVGTLLVAISVQFLQAASLFTGQIAGLALVGTQALDLSFSVLFFALNLPFYIIAYLRMGWEFTLKTFCAVGLLSLWTYVLPSVIVCISYAAAFYLMSLTLRYIPVGVTYAIWSGMGIVLIAVIGFIVFGQKLDWPAVAGMGLIVLGILVINLFSKTAVH